MRFAHVTVLVLRMADDIALATGSISQLLAWLEREEEIRDRRVAQRVGVTRALDGVGRPRTGRRDHVTDEELGLDQQVLDRPGPHAREVRSGGLARRGEPDDAAFRSGQDRALR